jgi:undecaprenyl phosphate N,N'-diacetylbacillosamine 1-phosphate transferase
VKESSFYVNVIKPFFDRSVSFFLLMILSPIILLLVLLLFIFNNGRIWFTQERPGLDGKPFTVIKFKTMTDEHDGNGNLLSDEKRLTWIGKFIRRTSFDEIPQLINVLKGEMSFVGPRPLLMEYLPLYNAQQSRRHSVRPGITGWAQVNGRNTISWEAKFEFDVWYVENISFWLDLKILLLTLMKVIKSEGISSGSSATMEKFRGTK